MSVIILYVLCSFLFKMRVLDSRLIFYFSSLWNQIFLFSKKKSKKKPIELYYVFKKSDQNTFKVLHKNFFLLVCGKLLRENIDIKIKYHIYQLQLLLLSALFCHRSWSRPSRSPSAPANSNFQEEKKSKELEKTKRGLPL